MMVWMSYGLFNIAMQPKRLCGFRVNDGSGRHSKTLLHRFYISGINVNAVKPALPYIPNLVCSVEVPQNQL